MPSIDLTLAAILTPGGAVAGAALITGLIAILKSLNGVGQYLTGNEPTVAFALSAILVMLAFWQAGPFTPAGAFGAFLAWFGIAQIAMGVHDTIKSVTAPKDVTPPLAIAPPTAPTPIPPGA